MHDELADAYSQDEDEPEDGHEEELAPDLSTQVKIAADQSTKIHLLMWLQEHCQDPAYQVNCFLESFLRRCRLIIWQDFLPQLKSHLLTCLKGNLAVGEEPECSPQELNELDFEYDTIYHWIRIIIFWAKIDDEYVKDIK